MDSRRGGGKDCGWYGSDAEEAMCVRDPAAGSDRSTSNEYRVAWEGISVGGGAAFHARFGRDAQQMLCKQLLVS